MMNIEVAPVSAIECVGAIVIALAHSIFLYFVLQLEVIIVASLSSSCGANAASWQIHLIFFLIYNNVLLCYAVLTSVRIPLSELPTVRPKCFTDRSPMCCANHGCIA